uniref:Ribosomal RNA large subunit methyltransferase K/L-like methyltransferase domain-containing protein n=1 Tax=Pygocentrus nattereri TaxID=42514 RepID=A0A3B4EC68_PYGNA
WFWPLARIVEHIPGRVFFCCRAALQELMRLKSAERLFLLLRKAPPTSLPKNPGITQVCSKVKCIFIRTFRLRFRLSFLYPINDAFLVLPPAKAASMIQQSIVGNPDVWRQALSTWAALQAELNGSHGRGQKRKREEEEDDVNGIKESVESEDACGLGQNRPTFRVSCRCSGAIARCCNSQNLSRIIGVAISQQLGWKADLRHCKVILCFAVYAVVNDLLSFISYCLFFDASVILDPMCGVGTILLEAAQECPSAVFIGMDSEEAQLQKAAENVEAAGQVNRMLLVQSSYIPLPTGSVDAVLCDVPFGRRFSCSTDMTSALPRILAEMERVLSDGGYLVLLLSLQLSGQIKKLVKSNTPNPESRAAGRNTKSPDHTHGVSKHSSEPDENRETERLKLSSLLLQNTHRVSLGSTDAIIHTYTKTHTLTH